MDYLFQRMEEHDYTLLSEIKQQWVALEQIHKNIAAQGNPSICSEVVTMGRNAEMLSAEVEMKLSTLKGNDKPFVDIFDESEDIVQMKQQILENMGGIRKICYVLQLSEIGNESDYYQSKICNFRVQKSLKVVVLHEQNSKLPPLKMDGDNMIYYFKDVVDNTRYIYIAVSLNWN
ncbi:uncharacterized protein LOC126571554 isoform X2 [Anopheles aquasalis]|uniref:uncharacterized protein LOC126571554 isoform X2 n=1 Tax=Anopheles aquasalis TaxID=42839 RepID=UPI00215A568A|nr:uncharacterized protein LOC126571554 isoform X2 [Anopheles aquasalis]